MNEEKQKALNSTIAMIEKQYGKGSIMKLGDTNVSNDLEIIPTGCLSLDLALGVGGVPRGRIIEVYGPRVKPQLRCILLQKRRKWAALRRLSMPSMRLTRSMRTRSALTRTSCICPSPTRANRRLTYANRLCVPARWTLLSLTRLRRLRPRRK